MATQLPGPMARCGRAGKIVLIGQRSGHVTFLAFGLDPKGEFEPHLKEAFGITSTSNGTSFIVTRPYSNGGRHRQTTTVVIHREIDGGIRNIRGLLQFVRARVKQAVQASYSQPVG